MTGATRSYSFASKCLWRRQVWNDIMKSTRRGRGVVLYLAGPEDNDRKIAIEKGFRNEDLIAIDTSRSNVQMVRSNGGYAVHGHFKDVIAAWPDDVPIRAVVLDFCSGLELDRIVEILRTASLCCSQGQGYAHIVVNMMRGRDTKWAKKAPEVRQYFADAITAISSCDRSGIARRIVRELSLVEQQLGRKHRGTGAFVMSSVCQLVALRQAGLCLEADREVALLKDTIQIAARFCFAKVGTYKSDRGLRFDSVGACATAWLASEKFAGDVVFGERVRDLRIRRSIAATLATRTRRMKARR